MSKFIILGSEDYYLQNPSEDRVFTPDDNEVYRIKKLVPTLKG
jgi:hypothetical protein